MRRHLFRAAAVLAAALSAGAVRQAPGAGGLTAAFEAWDRGDYVRALDRLRALAAAADEATFEHIALLTGELYRTSEVTTDGRAPALSIDGSSIVYETGPPAAPRAATVSNAPPGTEVRVTAVNARGLGAWDQARVVVR